MNAMQMIEACARHQGGIRVLSPLEPLAHDRETVYRPGGDFVPSDHGVTGHVPLEREE